jgi:UDP-glucose 4-epimerase
MRSTQASRREASDALTERGEMNSIEGTKILITGGAGFMGSTTADQLLDAGAAEVRVLDNFVRGSHRNLERARRSG